MTNKADIISTKIQLLKETLANNFQAAPLQVQGFLGKILNENSLVESLQIDINSIPYQGYPALAKLGYLIDTIDVNKETSVKAYLDSLDRIKERLKVRAINDPLSVLGISTGIKYLFENLTESKTLNSINEHSKILLTHVESFPPLNKNLQSANHLAAEILGNKGRWGKYVIQNQLDDSACINLCLFHSWKNQLKGVIPPDKQQKAELVSFILKSPVPDDALMCGIHLTALQSIINQIAFDSVPDLDQVSAILERTQGSFRRWPWEEKATRKGVIPARWIIDKEAHVQSFLLSVLAPYFKDDLVDEKSLPNYGLREGRFDFGILSMKLIIEVKVIRNSNEAKKLDAEILDDCGIYFNDGSPFDRMIVYIYDDMDKAEPEKYPIIKDTLIRVSSRVKDVVIVRRPSAIPSRKNRS